MSECFLRENLVTFTTVKRENSLKVNISSSEIFLRKNRFTFATVKGEINLKVTINHRREKFLSKNHVALAT